MNIKALAAIVNSINPPAGLVNDPQLIEIAKSLGATSGILARIVSPEKSASAARSQVKRELVKEAVKRGVQGKVTCQSFELSGHRLVIATI